jgi:uncharacterized protein (DUF927 family)
VPGYRISDKGIFEVSEDQSKPGIRLTLTPCGVLAHCRDGTQQNWGAYLRWVDRDTTIHEAPFPVGRFHEAGGTLPVDLANAGLPIMPGMEKRLLRYLAKGNPAARFRAAIQTGWQDGTSVFVLPNETFGGTNDPERVVYQPDRYSPTSQSVRASGSFEEWKITVAALCVDNPILAFWLSAALAPPLLRSLGMEGGGFHLFGRTSQGKTTAEQAAASLWGDGADPAEGRLSSFVKKWNLTKNATEGLAEAHNDLPLCLDEVGEADAREFGRTIYQLAGGQGKGRMRADATLKPSKAWRTLVLSTGEIPSADVVESEGKHLKGGQAVRLVDIPASDPLTGQGIIVHTHERSSSAAFADELKQACGTHYGWAGPAFVQGLIQEGLVAVGKDLRTALDETVRALAPPGASAEVVRVIKRFALVAIAGEKAAAIGILPWRKGEAFRSVQTILTRYLDARGGSGSHTERALESMKNFLLTHGSSRFRELTNETDRVINLAGYRDTNDGVFFFTPKGFREACSGHDVKEVARLLVEKGLLRPRDRGHLAERVTVPGMGRTRLYTISAEILDGETLASGPMDRCGI